MIEFEVGARPSKPISVAIRDELDNPVTTLGYSAAEVQILDTNNRPLDLTGVQVMVVPQEVGMYSIIFPNNRSLFTEKGKYLLRMVLHGPTGSKDITRTAEIRVRDFGRLN